MTTMVMVTVPEGAYEGQEFMLEYEGQQLTVCCPDGCGPGSDINLEIPVATGEGGAAPPNLVDVCVPDGCFPGMEFTVSFDGQEFNITVPDGVGPGEMMTVEVPSAAPAPPAQPSPAPEKKPPPKPKEQMKLAEIPDFRGAPSGKPKDKPAASKYLAGLDIPPFRGALKGVTSNSVNAHAKWEPASNLFDMGPDQGYGRAAGDFHIGQLVQVERSNGTWTYAKIMDYDPSGDVYSVSAPRRRSPPSGPPQAWPSSFRLPAYPPAAAPPPPRAAFPPRVARPPRPPRPWPFAARAARPSAAPPCAL